MTKHIGHPTKQNSQRNITLDMTRTLAIVLMVIFHFIYDLKLFGWIDWDIPDGQGWQQFRWVIVSLFFLALGSSLHFAYASSINYSKFLKRVLQISAGALLISIASYIAIPSNWIFFGVLHFLALASIICVGFANWPKLSFIIGISFFILAASDVLISRWPFHLLFDGLPDYTNDFVAPVPWLGMVFLGISLGHTQWLKRDPLQGKINPAVLRFAVWPGQHGLMIYLLHQPIMIALLYGLSLVIS
ncbi:heparan-alpha-glucosaminide N-acetyltransferase [Glaciecola siphonariae]|uniref:Heparan-alpha-glucosaminide N-acetyltransferase n=1 Tax=Glaciecola siphonariae TaxID=521012 RepID=A0ABV9LVZ9_9ALTE